ncbi:amino acid ABC transporter permease [Leucobacter denitrificans]|uniref:Amino acid ABC transporter permease n=1 Tax=Leucobacter denitrificans TaxID=683042 RepID=A0A7G9S2B6_9MICO|nr:amino acid ABC transporter permease [Leucobacter denitrificans]QNN61991.1 amino acid ABC transporter permease [Leucobacter denitrificans]
MMVFFEFFPALLRGLQYTLLVAVVSFVAGGLLAIAITAARRSSFGILRFLGGAWVEILRGVPPLAWLFIVYFGFPIIGLRLSPIETGIWVFSLVASAYLTEIYRSGLRAVPTGQVEAGTALGMSRLKVNVLVVFPQAVKTILPLAVGYLIAILKDSAFVSVVGVADVTSIATSLNRSSGEGLLVFLAAGLVYLAISVPVGIFGRWLDERFSGRRTRVQSATTLTEAVTIK